MKTKIIALTAAALMALAMFATPALGYYYTPEGSFGGVVNISCEHTGVFHADGRVEEISCTNGAQTWTVLAHVYTDADRCDPQADGCSYKPYMESDAYLSNNVNLVTQELNPPPPPSVAEAATDPCSLDYYALAAACN